MKEAILFLAEIVNDIHDLFINAFQMAGLQLTDKQLHFWVIGIIGIVFFFFTHIAFKGISRYSIGALSFIYTFTVLLIFVFAIEIQQKVTNRGNMEFEDAVVGLWGFIVLFLVSIAFVGIKRLLFILFTKRKKEKVRQHTRMGRYHSS